MNDDKDKYDLDKFFEIMFQLEQVKHNSKELSKAKRYIKTAAQANMVGLLFAIGCFIAFFADSIAGPMLVCWVVCVSFAELYISRVSRIMYEAHPAFVTNPPPGRKELEGDNCCRFDKLGNDGRHDWFADKRSIYRICFRPDYRLDADMGDNVWPAEILQTQAR